jgi:hypothetical protein
MARRVIVEFDNDTALGVAFEGHIGLFRAVSDTFKPLAESQLEHAEEARHTIKNMEEWSKAHEENNGTKVWYCMIASKVPLNFKRILEDFVGDIEL